MAGLIVCHCRCVDDTTLAHAVTAGARTPRDVARATGAGTACGGCVRSIRAVIEAALAPDPALVATAALAG